jgi:hypothetical protein
VSTVSCLALLPCRGYLFNGKCCMMMSALKKVQQEGRRSCLTGFDTKPVRRVLTSRYI